TPMRPREALFELECDVLVPGARPHSITSSVAQDLRCAVVSPGANIPYGAGSLAALFGRGVIAIPDFLSNAGATLMYELDQDTQPGPALAIEALVRERVATVLTSAQDDQITPYVKALRDAHEYLAEATNADPKVLDELFCVEQRKATNTCLSRVVPAAGR